MKIKDFEDTDTALLEFGDGTPVETRELSEDIYIDLGETGHVVSITLEHSSLRGDLSEVSFKRIARGTVRVASRWVPGEALCWEP